MSVVYTTAFGRTDPLQEPRCDSGWRFVCFTDLPIKSKRWEIVRLPPQAAPTRECRKLKQRPHVVFPEADVTLWMDCCFSLLRSPEEIAKEYPGEFTAFRHHKRTRIVDEAEAIIQAGKGEPAAVRAQLAAYQADGWDTDDRTQRVIHNGGFLLRRNTAKVREHAEAWHREVQTRTLRDQMSIDYTAAKVGLQIGDFVGIVPRNRYARIQHFNTPTNDF